MSEGKSLKPKLDDRPLTPAEERVFKRELEEQMAREWVERLEDACRFADAKIQRLLKENRKLREQLNELISALKTSE